MSRLPLVDRPNAIQRLNQGECVALPTETVYGLAADIQNPDAIGRIFSTKERPFFDPLIVHISDSSQLEQVVSVFPPLAKKLAQRYWPGPLTMVLPKHKALNNQITSGLETVAVRMPKQSMTLEIINEVGPLAAPSANKFGRTSPTRAEHVIAEFDGLVPVLDGGPCEIGVESTVVGFNETFTKIKVYRPGAITREMLRAIAPVEVESSPVAPGHLEHHYMPTIPLVILPPSLKLNETTYNHIQNSLKIAPLRPSLMRLPKEAHLATRDLYQNLRSAAHAKPYVNCIFLEYDIHKKNRGLWHSITDRLTKAASLIVEPQLS